MIDHFKTFTQTKSMRVSNIYLDLGNQCDEPSNMVLKDITDSVLVCLNLLRGVNKDSSDHYIKACHKEADLLTNKIIDLRTGHSVDETIIANQ